MEIPVRIEPTIKELQSFALPLGYIPKFITLPFYKKSFELSIDGSKVMKAIAETFAMYIN